MQQCQPKTSGTYLPKPMSYRAHVFWQCTVQELWLEAGTRSPSFGLDDNQRVKLRFKVVAISYLIAGIKSLLDATARYI